MLGIISTKNLNQMSTAQIMYFVCRRQTELGLFRFKAGKIKLGKKKKKETEGTFGLHYKPQTTSIRHAEGIRMARENDKQ